MYASRSTQTLQIGRTRIEKRTLRTMEVDIPPRLGIDDKYQRLSSQAKYAHIFIVAI